MPARKHPCLKIKVRKTIFEVTPNDFIATAILLALILDFYLLITGNFEGADKYMMFLGGYGLGSLIQQILINLYHGKRRRYDRSKRAKKARKAG